MKYTFVTFSYFENIQKKFPKKSCFLNGYQNNVSMCWSKTSRMPLNGHERYTFQTINLYFQFM